MPDDDREPSEASEVPPVPAGVMANPTSRAKFLASEQLVFGIIALQNNFISREAFIAAFDA